MSLVFLTQRVMQQECPISPLLFILTLESRVAAIRKDKCMSGIDTPAGCLKIMRYTDDILLNFSNPDSSLPHPTALIDAFSIIMTEAAAGRGINLQPSPEPEQEAEEKEGGGGVASQRICAEGEGSRQGRQGRCPSVCPHQRGAHEAHVTPASQFIQEGGTPKPPGPLRSARQWQWTSRTGIPWDSWWAQAQAYNGE
ncbi:hypothetical protein NDU88_003385 [Pleurodeles waltl]|uniref:Reverse transcriptase domain-containing protein n=1 Tax=Pleurodeles waltl TaxID=8319 RepID=A0AAV7RGF4_PLEWA|nr:hypothetical protein NDU88_003385 [Pleurodeles waltl]